jgi:hypothetical protein
VTVQAGVRGHGHQPDAAQGFKPADLYQFDWVLPRRTDRPVFYNNAGEAGHADFGSFTYRYGSSITRQTMALRLPLIIATGLLASIAASPASSFSAIFPR